MRAAEIVTRLRKQAESFGGSVALVNQYRCRNRRLRQSDIASALSLEEDLAELAMTFLSVAGQIQIRRLTDGDL